MHIQRYNSTEHNSTPPPPLPAPPQFITNSNSLPYFRVHKHRKFHTYKYVTNLRSSVYTSTLHHGGGGRVRWMLFRCVNVCDGYNQNLRNQPTSTREKKEEHIKFPLYKYCESDGFYREHTKRNSFVAYEVLASPWMRLKNEIEKLFPSTDKRSQGNEKINLFVWLFAGAAVFLSLSFSLQLCLFYWICHFHLMKFGSVEITLKNEEKKNNETNIFRIIIVILVLFSYCYISYTQTRT